MVDPIASGVEIAIALFLVILNGFFVASEFAFVRIRESSVEEMVENGAFGSEILTDVMNELDTYLAVTQLGITVASLALGWVGEPAIAEVIEALIGGFVPESVLHTIAFAVGFSIITFLHVVFGELAPKTLSIQRTEQIAQIVAPPMKFFRYLFIPGIIVFNGAANRATTLVGVEPASDSEETYSEDEIRSVLTNSGKRGKVDEKEVKMINRVFEMDDMKVKEIMVPRPDVTTIQKDDEHSEILDMVQDENHTRYPVVEDNEVLGFIDIKDIFGNLESHQSEEATAEEIMDSIEVIPESSSVKKGLETLQRTESQMAAVVDEWGVFEGIVTVEDTVEVVVGDLRDKYDTENDEPTVEETEDGHLCDGSLSLSKLNSQIGTEFSEEDIDTVAGLVLSETATVPDVGSKVKKGKYMLEVSEKESNRIKEIEISRVKPEDGQD